MPTHYDLYLIAGEPSGDLQGAHLIEALLSESPRLKIASVAGPRMRAFPIECTSPMENLQVMGFFDVVHALPRIYKMYRKILKDILKKNPKAVVCIDYPGFNIRLERALRRRGFSGKLIHYVCPTVWAWGKGRIPIMAKNLDLLLCLFPFEKKCFSHTSLPVEYVGHPLVKKVSSYIPFVDFKERYHLDPTKKILALFPGSRRSEIERNFPIQLKAAQSLQKSTPDLQIAISVSQPQFRPFFSQYDIPLIEPEHNYDLMQNAHLAIATSGTVTLEIALFQTPCVVNFAIRPRDVFLAEKIFKINLPHYAMPNILAGETIYPELFGPHLTIDSLTQAAFQMWHKEAARAKCRAGCKKIIEILGNADAAANAARAILK